MTLIFKNDARFFVRLVTMWLSLKNYWRASKWSSISFSHWQCPSEDFSPDRLLFSTVCWSINTKSMVETRRRNMCQLLKNWHWNCAIFLFYFGNNYSSIPLFLHNTYHLRLLPEGVDRYLRYSFEMPMFYQNNVAVRNTAPVTGGKPIAVCSLSHPLLRFYDMGRKGEVLLFCSVPHKTRDNLLTTDNHV
jgi:hypothetical protein